MLVTKPPMGWNSWNTFCGSFSESVIVEIAQAMVDTGLKDVGYNIIALDDKWSIRGTDRLPDGTIEPDPEKFPYGMKHLTDQLHAMGFKFGIYSCDGTKTCGGYPGSYNNEFIDAKTFADWGVDYLKYDNCYKPDVPGKILYNRMSMALKATGRDFIFSSCNWGTEDVMSWIRSTGAHLYRTTGDISDSYDSFRDLAISQIDNFARSGSNCYNDVDMMIVGMKGKGFVSFGDEGCTYDEYLLHFAYWCYFQSPLMLGCDVRTIDDESLSILKHKELLRIDQDAEVRPPFKIWQEGGRASFLKHLEDGEYALAFFNFEDSDAVVPAEFKNFGLDTSTGMAMELKDIITGERLKNVYGELCPEVKAHSFKMYRGRVVEKI